MNRWDIQAMDGVLGVVNVATDISDLVTGLRAELGRANRVTLFWDLLKENPSFGRSGLHLHVSQEFFETFFNSAIGYRAMFRRGPRVGSTANAAIIDAVRSALSASLGDAVEVHQIGFGPEWIGRVTISRSTFLRSMDPSLAKIWYSTAEICLNGTIRPLPFGVADTKIDVGLPHLWAEIRQDAPDCFIEVKGAFVGKFGLFQIKDPELRAHTLAHKGEA